MRATLPLIVTAAALTLSACSKSPEQPAAEMSSGAAPEATSASPDRASPTFPSQDSDAALPSASASDVAASTPSAVPTDDGKVATNEIPPAIRGRWGLVPKDCTSRLGDAKGLLTVTAGQLKFYESVARLGKVKEAEPTRIRASFAYSGEGMAWTQDVVLDAQDGGKTLIRRDYGPDAQPGPLKYTRCS